MSPGAGLRPSPPPLLRYAERPTVLIQHHRGRVTTRTTMVLPRASGGRRSEVKEEAGRSPAGGHERRRPPDALGTLDPCMPNAAARRSPFHGSRVAHGAMDH